MNESRITFSSDYYSAKKKRPLSNEPHQGRAEDLPELSEPAYVYKSNLLDFFYNLTSHLVNIVKFIGSRPSIGITKFKQEILNRWDSLIQSTNLIVLSG